MKLSCISFLLFFSLTYLANAQTSNYYVEQTSTFSQLLSDIALVSAPVNSIIRTSNGGVYVVDSDSISTHVVVKNVVCIRMQNGNFALLQTRNGGFHVEDFGAIANDNVADDDAIQLCIDAATILGKRKLYRVGKINFGPGIFDLDKGVVVADNFSDPSTVSGVDTSVVTNEYLPITMKIKGAIPIYENNFAGTTLRLSDSTFAIAIQEARMTTVENIFFEGSSRSRYRMTSDTSVNKATLKDYVEWDDEEWGVNSGARINRYSPSCAIVIDPFFHNVPSNDQYVNHTSRYSNSQTDGSSMITISNCGFAGHYIAIANNPSDGVKNGDNIRVKDSHVKNCHTFWACGQTQSRSNSIDNVYSTIVHTFVSANKIGTRQGTVPVLNNCNIAGFTKLLFDVTTSGYGPIRVCNSYMESMFSLGRFGATSVVFENTQIKFIIPSEGKPDNGTNIYSAPYHLYTGLVASFIDCTIEYFGNNTVHQPLMIMSDELNIIGGYLQTGVLINRNLEFDNVSYKGVALSNYNTHIVGNRTRIMGSQLHHGKLTGKVMLGGDEFITSFNNGGICKFENNGATYGSYSLGTVDLNINEDDNTGWFLAGSDSGRYKVNDNLVPNLDVVDPEDVHMVNGYIGWGSRFIPTPLGYVSEINGDTIIVKGIPYGMDEGDISISCVYYPRFYYPMWGDFTYNSDIVQNMVWFKKPSVGDRFFNEAIPNGTYITAVDETNMELTLSQKAIKFNVSESLMYNADYTQIVEESEDPFPTGSDEIPYIKGARIYMLPADTTSQTVGYSILKGGLTNSSLLPINKAITW